MILIGLKNESSSTGSGEGSYSVTHQRTEIIAGSPNDTAESLAQLYHAMIQKAKDSRSKLDEITEELEWREVSNEEFEQIEKKSNKLRQDLNILKYDRVIILDGVILK
jgi:hypothetical protein